MRNHLPLGLLAVCLTGALGAQGTYQNANAPDDPICPLIQRDKTSLNYGGSGALGSTGGKTGADAAATLFYQQGGQFFPVDQRKPVSTFTAYDEKGQGTSVASLKGKVVLVGLWSTHCDPSAKMLMEFASLYAKRDQYGFEILSVNFDETQQDSGIEGGWRAISKFRIKNRQFFDASKMPIYTPGLGKEGASNFMDMVHSVPVLFVVDRQGKLAEIHIGYKDGFVGQALMRALRERVPAPLPAPPPTPEGAKPSPS
jgi:glutathione peroxidase-family protein